MKVILRIILCMSAMIIPCNTLAQEQCQPMGHVGGPGKFDEYGNIPFSCEKVRLNSLVFQLQREQTYVAYLLVYAGRKSCAGEARAHAIRVRNYLVSERGIRADRIIWKDAGYREKFTVEIWTWPRDVGEPFPALTLNPSEVKVIKCKAKRMRRKRGT